MADDCQALLDSVKTRKAFVAGKSLTSGRSVGDMTVLLGIQALRALPVFSRFGSVETLCESGGSCPDLSTVGSSSDCDHSSPGHLSTVSLNEVQLNESAPAAVCICFSVFGCRFDCFG